MTTLEILIRVRVTTLSPGNREGSTRTDTNISILPMSALIFSSRRLLFLVLNFASTPAGGVLSAERAAPACLWRHHLLVDPLSPVLRTRHTKEEP